MHVVSSFLPLSDEILHPLPIVYQVIVLTILKILGLFMKKIIQQNVHFENSQLFFILIDIRWVRRKPVNQVSKEEASELSFVFLPITWQFHQCGGYWIEQLSKTKTLLWLLPLKGIQLVITEFSMKLQNFSLSTLPLTVLQAKMPSMDIRLIAETCSPQTRSFCWVALIYSKGIQKRLTKFPIPLIRLVSMSLHLCCQYLLHSKTRAIPINTLIHLLQTVLSVWNFVLHITAFA